MVCNSAVIVRLLLAAILAGGCLGRAYSQELFPHTEPASNIPSGVLGLRLASESYDEVGQARNWMAFKVLYGITPDLMVTQTASFSNHHGSTLPDDFVTTDGGLGGMHTHGTTKGVAYPYLFETYNLNLKYRFYVDDGHNEHLRGAVWGEMAFGSNAHDEAEPSLMGDNNGFAAGVIFTKLHKRLAVSLGLSGILPLKYHEEAKDLTFQYGNAFHYSLSFGYLVLPKEYKSYDQVNVNIYAEFLGRAYGGATIDMAGENVLTDGVPSLESGHYLELRPAIQFIFWSNTRLDVSSSFLVAGESYTKFYPVFYMSLQHYFYL